MRHVKSTIRTLLGLPVADWLIVMILTFPIMGTLFPFDSYLQNSPGNAGGEAAQVSRSTTIILALILLYVLVLFCRSPGKSLAACRRSWIIFVYLGWCFFTSTWAFNTAVSFNRTGRMLVFALFAIYIVEFLDQQRRARIVWAAMFLSCLISMVFIIALPSLSHMTDVRGSWRGAMMHKNVLGGLAGMLLIASLLYLHSGAVPRKLCIAATALSALTLFLSNNAGSIVSVVAILGIMAYVISLVNRTRAPLFVLFAGGAVLAGLGTLIASSDFFFELIGRDRNLTGRDGVGRFVEMMIDAEWFWGYGHAVWADPVFKELGARATGWPVPNAHNAWLDFHLQLGFPGLVIAVAMWVMTLKNLLQIIAVRNFALIAFPTAAFIFLSIRTLAETVLTDPSLNEMFWFAFAYASLAQAVSARRPSEKRLHRGGGFHLGPRRFGADPVAITALGSDFGTGPRFGAG